MPELRTAEICPGPAIPFTGSPVRRDFGQMTHVSTQSILFFLHMVDFEWFWLVKSGVKVGKNLCQPWEACGLSSSAPGLCPAGAWKSQQCHRAGGAVPMYLGSEQIFFVNFFLKDFVHLLFEHPFFLIFLTFFFDSEASDSCSFWFLWQFGRPKFSAPRDGGLHVGSSDVVPLRMSWVVTRTFFGAVEICIVL